MVDILVFVILCVGSVMLALAVEYVDDIRAARERQHREQQLADHLQRRRRVVERERRRIEADLIRHQAELDDEIQRYRRQQAQSQNPWWS